MKQVTCSSCSAGFEVDFAPGTEFTCGACGAVVVVPAAAAPPPRVAPVARPRQAPAPSPRPAPPPKRAPAERHAAPPPPPSGAARKQKLIILGAVGGTAVVLLVLGIVAMASGSGAEPSTSPTAGPASSTKPAEGATPVVQAPVTRPVEPPKPPKVRPSDPLGAARFDADQSGAGAIQHLNFADLAYERAEQLESEGKRDEAASLRREALSAYAEVIKIEGNQERARQRLGYVKFDMGEAKKLAEMAYLPRKLKANISEAIEQLEQKTKGKQIAWPIWMSVKGGAYEDMAADWRKSLREAKEYEALEEEKLTDSFYDRARSMAGAVEGDVGPVLRRRKLEGPTFDAYPRKPFVVIVQRDKDFETQPIAEHWCEVLMQLRETFLARFRKLNLPIMDRPTPVLVLRYDTDYAKYLKRGDARTIITSQAHFEPFSKRLVTWKEPDRTDRTSARTVSEDEVRTVLFHEGTHQLVDYYTKTRATNLNESLWFSEGIADYFGGHGRSWDDTAGKWRYEPGLINVERVSAVGDAKTGGFLFKLKDLLAYRRGDYEREKEVNPARTLTAYAQGWALVYLLSNWEDNKHREKFDDYVKKELNGESGVAAFEAVFGADSVDRIEKELHAMIDALFKAAKDKKIVNGKLMK